MIILSGLEVMVAVSGEDNFTSSTFGKIFSAGF